MTLKDLKMTLNEIYQTCRLLFADKHVETYSNVVRIMWGVKHSDWRKGGSLRDIYIIEHDTTYFEISSNLKRLPSWFAAAIKYKKDILGNREFKGFKV